MNGFRISNAGNPTATQDLATKSYVDSSTVALNNTINSVGYSLNYKYSQQLTLTTPEFNVVHGSSCLTSYVTPFNGTVSTLGAYTNQKSSGSSQQSYIRQVIIANDSGTPGNISPSAYGYSAFPYSASLVMGVGSSSSGTLSSVSEVPLIVTNNMTKTIISTVYNYINYLHGWNNQTNRFSPDVNSSWPSYNMTHDFFASTIYASSWWSVSSYQTTAPTQIAYIDLSGTYHTVSITKIKKNIESVKDNKIKELINKKDDWYTVNIMMNLFRYLLFTVQPASQ